MKLFTKKPKYEIYWTNRDIPAKVFFDTLYDQHFQRLGTAPPEQLEKVFDVIFDEYVDYDSNTKVIEWYKKNAKIALMESNIALINSILYVISFASLKRLERLKMIEQLNSIKGVHVNFNIDKPVLEEIHRVQTQVLGYLRTEIHIEKATEKKQKEGIKHSFEKDMVNISSVMGYHITNNITLKEYQAYKEMASERAKQNIKKNGK